MAPVPLTQSSYGAADPLWVDDPWKRSRVGPPIDMTWSLTQKELWDALVELRDSFRSDLKSEITQLKDEISRMWSIGLSASDPLWDNDPWRFGHAVALADEPSGVAAAKDDKPVDPWYAWSPKVSADPCIRARPCSSGLPRSNPHVNGDPCATMRDRRLHPPPGLSSSPPVYAVTYAVAGEECGSGAESCETGVDPLVVCRPGSKPHFIYGGISTDPLWENDPWTQVETVVREAPQLQVVEDSVEVPEVTIQEKIVHVPGPLTQEKVGRPVVVESVSDIRRIVEAPTSQDLHQAADALQEAEAHLRKEQALLNKNLGNAEFKEGKYRRAISCYDEALAALVNDIDPEVRAALHSNISQCYLKLGRYEGAEHEASIALGFEPDNRKALYRRGQARLHLSSGEPCQKQAVDEKTSGDDRQEVTDITCESCGKPSLVLAGDFGFPGSTLCSECYDTCYDEGFDEGYNAANV